MKATDLDYVRGLHESLESPKRTVSEVMTTEVVTVPPDMILGRAARLMVEKHLKRLPVVDASGKLMGILGRLDILNTIAAVHLRRPVSQDPSDFDSMKQFSGRGRFLYDLPSWTVYRSEPTPRRRWFLSSQLSVRND
jgi:signal-transduction protein with cAMP-binding, CBS, and nucleotidyltransferase domain